MEKKERGVILKSKLIVILKCIKVDPPCKMAQCMHPVLCVFCLNFNFFVLYLFVSSSLDLVGVFLRKSSAYCQ